MKKTHKDIITVVSLFVALALASNGYRVTAQMGGGSASSTAGRTQTRIERIAGHANQEIDRRVSRLNQVVARLGEMNKISASQKAALAGPLQAQITQLTALQAKVRAGGDVQTLLADAQSITQSYRIFALIIPQAAIAAMADRTMAITDTINALSSKLQARIADMQAGGKDVGALQLLLADMGAKNLSANTQAQAAISGIEGLSPDQGNQALAVANKQALVAAKTKLQAARHDLQIARQDAGEIVKGLSDLEVSGLRAPTTESSTTATTSH